MRPTTSAAATSATANQLYDFEPNILTVEDCRYLLRSLEKQAFEHVFYAFRAQGPLTQYKELLLEHIKTALFINDEDFTLHARIAANNPYLIKIAQELNPSYDNYSEWIAAGYDLSSVDLARARRHTLDRHNNQFATNVNQILREIHRHNISLQHESKQLAELYQIPKRPFVPERLRRFLQDTESNIDGRIDTMPANTKDATIANPPAELKTIKKPVKNGVGRPRKNSTLKNPNPVKPMPIDSGMMPCCSTQLSSFPNKSIENNSRKSRPPIPLDLSSAKSPEEQAVLAILAQSSAQISQQEAFEQQMREQMAETSSVTTATTAMESLVEIALAQAQMEILPIQNPIKVLPQIPSKLPAMLTSSQNELHEEKNGPAVALMDSKSLTQPQCEEIANTNRNNNLIEKAAIDDIRNQPNLTVGAILKPKRKRPAKQLDEKGSTCARVRPFVFEMPLDGKPKPPRGNPDKKIHPPMKRPNSQQNYDYTFGNGPLTNNIAISQSYYPQFNSNSKYYNNSNNDHCYNERLGAAVPSVVIASTHPTIVNATAVENHNIPTEIIVVNAMPDATGNNKCNEQNGTISNGISTSGQAHHIFDSSLPSTSYKIGQSSAETTASSQNNVPEESGLDFLASLASTASLLAPIEMNIKNQQQLQ